MGDEEEDYIPEDETAFRVVWGPTVVSTSFDTQEEAEAKLEESNSPGHIQTATWTVV